MGLWVRSSKKDGEDEVRRRRHVRVRPRFVVAAVALLIVVNLLILEAYANASFVPDQRGEEGCGGPGTPQPGKGHVSTFRRHCRGRPEPAHGSGGGVTLDGPPRPAPGHARTTGPAIVPLRAAAGSGGPPAAVLD